MHSENWMASATLEAMGFAPQTQLHPLNRIAHIGRQRRGRLESHSGCDGCSGVAIVDFKYAPAPIHAYQHTIVDAQAANRYQGRRREASAYISVGVCRGRETFGSSFQPIALRQRMWLSRSGPPLLRCPEHTSRPECRA